MRMKGSMMVSVIVLAGLLAFCVLSQVVPASDTKKDSDNTIRNMQARVAALEAQMASLQKRLQNMENKSSGVLTIPDPRGFRFDAMPPGSKQHEIGGIKYWTVPLRAGQ